MSSVEDVSLRLAAIHDELAALPDGPSPERYILLKELDLLREEAAGFVANVDTERPTTDLEAELASLRRSRKQILDARKGYVMSKGGDNAGPASGTWVKLSIQSRSAAGVDRLNVRISRIEDVLASRREDNPE